MANETYTRPDYLNRPPFLHHPWVSCPDCDGWGGWNEADDEESPLSLEDCAFICDTCFGAGGHWT